MARILVVDDHAPNRELITALLGYAGHESMEACDGAEALQVVRAERPELVICDILMPAMDGYEFVHRLRAEPDIAHTEVVFCTATFIESEARKLAAACGVAQVMFKPCEPQEVLDVVQTALAQHRASPSLPETADFDREHLRLVTDKLVALTSELRTANERLSALTDLNLRLASEHDPAALLDQVCRGARDLFGASFAVLGVVDDEGGGPAHYASWGLGPAAALGELPADLQRGLLGNVMREQESRRFFNPTGEPSALGLPDQWPRFTNGLAAPIVSPTRAYGWICMMQKLGDEGFTDEDERLLTIHAAQVGRIYENGSLYRAMKRNAELLQVANETLEQRVESRTVQLREMIDGLESFTRTVSHDLRGPLGGIAGAARLARESISQGNTARAVQVLDLIADSARNSEHLVNTLLSLARASETELKRQTVDTRALVYEVLVGLEGAHPDVSLIVDELPSVEADPTLLRQVFVNLITNAIKFAGAGRQPRVQVGATVEPTRTVFFVRDNGVGFNSERAHQLFQPFQRLHGSQYEGFGLGLSIVKRIVDRHAGNAWAEGIPGQGASFYFSLGK